MVEFYGIFAILSAISNNNRGGGWDGRQGGWDRTGRGGVGGGKNHSFGHSISSHGAHTVANDTPVSHIASGSKSRSPLPNWHPPWVPLFQP